MLLIPWEASRAEEEEVEGRDSLLHSEKEQNDEDPSGILCYFLVKLLVIVILV